MIRIAPPNSRNQLPLIPNHLSSAYGNSAWVEIRPANTAPEISVIPPAYANAIRLSAVNTSNRSALTEPKLYAYSQAARPAIPALTPNAISLTMRGSIAAAAAARSFERTASIRRPRSPRLIHATVKHAATVTASATQPKTGLGRLPSSPRNDDRAPRSSPSSFSSGTGEPVWPPPQVVLRKPKFVIATTAASVTTARLTPRTRNADAAVIRPRMTATTTPASGARGKPIPALTARCEIVNPDTPASVSCTTEIWPTNPVITTSDSAITGPISVLISASRKSNGRTTSEIAHTATAGTVVRRRCCGRGASGRLFSTSSPRPGRLAPRRYMNSTIST